MAEPRQIPTWLRIILNLCGPLGLAATLMGYVRPLWGILVIIAGFAHIFWEIAPGTTLFLRRSALVSLIVFVFVGGLAGAFTWWGWKSLTKRPSPLIAPSITWENPAPIGFGIPLSSKQLNARFSVDGNPVYSPDIGSVLPVGTHPLRVDFAPSDPNKYQPTSKTIEIVVDPPLPAPPSKRATAENPVIPLMKKDESSP